MARMVKMRSRAVILSEKRRMRRPWILGTCSNCRKKNVPVKRVAGCQICDPCGRHLPGHLLRFMFPTFGRIYTEQEAYAAGMPRDSFPDPPAPAERREKTWREKIDAKLQRLRRWISPKR